MTRINVGIHPYELPNKLLLAEHREITRIPNAIRSGKINLDNLPTQFTLGKGHVRFFYNKLEYLRKRYGALLKKCKQRGFQVTDKTNSFDCCTEYPHLFQDYQEQPQDRQIIIDRIKSKGFKLQREYSSV